MTTTEGQVSIFVVDDDDSARPGLLEFLTYVTWLQNRGVGPRGFAGRRRFSTQTGRRRRIAVGRPAVSR